MLGNEAIARGAYEVGVSVTSAYPGTPSTEICEYISKYDEIFSEWAPNEKVALEVCIGASIGGARSLCAMKHVGLNVAADPLFTASYTGVNAGMVICVADDPGMHSSQNEQDSRHYAIGSKTLMLEPADSSECKEYVKRAFLLSEEFDTPVLIRLTTRVSHSQSLVEEGEREEILKDYTKDAMKYVMMPGMAKLRHVVVEDRIQKLTDLAESIDINRIEKGSTKIGVITSGVSYQYAKEALGDNASYLKLGMVYPLPKKLILDFVKSVDICYVVEELDPIFEDHCKALGAKVIGKEAFTLLGEYTVPMIKKAILGEETEIVSADEPIANRPPVMCAGCPHRGTFYVLKSLNLRVTGDIGCYTLGALAPLQALDTCVCMGASIGVAHGMDKARGRDFSAGTVAVLGDSTFIHSGITGLIDVVYNKGTSTVLILDNSITGMTGHQENPCTGRTIKGEPTKQVDLEMLCKAIGVERVRVVDPFEVEEMKKMVKEEVMADEPSVIIVQRPCALLKSVKYTGKMKVNDKCTGCGVCLKMGCPAMRKVGKLTVIDSTQCNGCGLCAKVCKFGALVMEEK